jgi:hypothetical protein
VTPEAAMRPTPDVMQAATPGAPGAAMAGAPDADTGTAAGAPVPTSSTPVVTPILTEALPRRPAAAPSASAPPTDPLASLWQATPSASAPPTDPLASLWQEPPAATRLAAVRALLDAWYAPIPLQAGQDPCAQVGAAGLRCLTEQGSWPGLFALDRPAVLELWRATDDAPRHLALLASDAGTLTVQVGEARLRLPRTAIERDWRGHALVLWQMPPGYGRPSRRGDDDTTSAWLAERLALLDGEGAEGGPLNAPLETPGPRYPLGGRLAPDCNVLPWT